MPVAQQQIFTLLYTSELAADVPLTAVAAIIKFARANNGPRGLSGLLAFDGARFAQLIQGPEASVNALAERLTQAETRHIGMRVLLRAPVEGPALFPEWRMGYLQLDEDASAIEALHAEQGLRALQAFARLVPQLDLGLA